MAAFGCWSGEDEAKAYHRFDWKCPLEPAIAPDDALSMRTQPWASVAEVSDRWVQRAVAAIYCRVRSGQPVGFAERGMRHAKFLGPWHSSCRRSVLWLPDRLGQFTVAASLPEARSRRGIRSLDARRLPTFRNI